MEAWHYSLKADTGLRVLKPTPTRFGAFHAPRPSLRQEELQARAKAQQEQQVQLQWLEARSARADLAIARRARGPRDGGMFSFGGFFVDQVRVDFWFDGSFFVWGNISFCLFLI